MRSTSKYEVGVSSCVWFASGVTFCAVDRSACRSATNADPPEYSSPETLPLSNRRSQCARSVHWFSSAGSESLSPVPVYSGGRFAVSNGMPPLGPFWGVPRRRKMSSVEPFGAGRGHAVLRVPDNREEGGRRRLVAPEDACPPAEQRLVEVEGVDVLIAEDPRQVGERLAAERIRRDLAVEMHDRAEAWVAGIRHERAARVLADPPEVAEDVDVVSRDDPRVRIGEDVVADAQEDRADRRMDVSLRDAFGRVLDEQDGSAREEVQVLTLDRALADGEPEGRRVVGSERLREDDARVACGLGHVDVVVGAEADGAAEHVVLRVDLQIVRAV